MTRKLKTIIASVLCVVLLASMMVPIASAANPPAPAIQALSPWGVINPPVNTPLAERPNNLQGAHIGMIWYENLYTGPLERLGGLQFANAIKSSFGVLGATFEDIILDEIRVNYQTPQWYDEMAEKLDAVVIVMADSTNTTYWAAAYARQFEMRGVPSVVMTTSTFEPVLEASAEAHGITALRSVVIPASVYARAFENMAVRAGQIIGQQCQCPAHCSYSSIDSSGEKPGSDHAAKSVDDAHFGRSTNVFTSSTCVQSACCRPRIWRRAAPYCTHKAGCR